MGALALTGRRSLQEPYGEYLVGHPHIAPATWRFDPTGEAALQELDRALEAAGPETIAAFLCEPVSAAALPGYTPPDAFWEGLAQRREQHGFVVVFDEVVTGMGRTGSWFAAHQLPIEPDIITGGKGLGAGYAPLAATLCTDAVFEPLAAGSRNFEHGHTWDGAPLPCAVGLAVLDALIERDLIERVRTRGPSLRAELEQALVGVGDRPRGARPRLPARGRARRSPRRRVAACQMSSMRRRSSTRPRSSTGCSSPPRTRRRTASPATRCCSRRRSSPATTISRR